MSDIDSRPQHKRTADRKRQDKENSLAAAERAGNCCEACGLWAPPEHGGVGHHSHRKGAKALRNDMAFIVHLCWRCHHDAHGNNPQDINERCEAIIKRRKENA